MTIVDVLMPAADSPYAGVAPDHLAPYVPAFAAHGLTLLPRPWDAGPGDGAATLALFAWGYHLAPRRWLAMLAAWPVERPLFNAAATITWNTRKTYLRDLDRAGVAIVPSHFGRADADGVAIAMGAFDCTEVVVKPQVSGGGHNTLRLGPGKAFVPFDDAMIQPFLPAILDEGELSLLFIGGRFSHAVRKVAAPGDFRIQPQFGGRFNAFDPTPDHRALAERALATLHERPLYARIDLIRLPDGTLAVMELEAIEPDLYVEQEPAVPTRLADALIASM